MATIHFSSGKTRDIGVEEFERLPVKLQQRGIKTMFDRNEERTLMIPLNSNTIEFIEEIHEIKPEEDIQIDVSDVETINSKVDELAILKAELKASAKEMEEKKDPEEKQKEAMDEMMAKSNCTHSTMSIYRQDTSKGSRYFPVCTFCGKRERYVKADSLTDEVKENAIIWEE